ncbi:MAG TPA: EAL domain-containing protein [Pseudorhizobium sp.]|nr:EAL domain-containing protein [Pseudorhizobium sp.]
MKRLLAIIVCCFILATGYIAYVIAERQAALQKVARYNEAWTVSQTLAEFMRLEHRLASHGLDPAMVDLEEVRLRLDFMFSRLDTFEQGTLREFIGSDEHHQQVLRTLRTTLEALDRDLMRSEHLDLARHLASLAALDGPMTRLASAAAEFGTSRIDQDQGHLIRLHLIYTALAAGLITCGIALLILLLHHNRLLNKAHKGMRRLTENLQEASDELQAHNHRLTHVAHHDSLTGLPNRIQFRERLDEILDAPGNSRHPIALLFLDLDGFKDVNDTLGHDVGDALLKAVAERLQAALDGSDFVCRLGGDEFAILTSGGEDGRGLDVARRLIEDVGTPYSVNGREIQIGTSIGVAVSDDGVAPDDILKQADLALYEAKASGRGKASLFRPAMFTELQDRKSFETDLREALAKGEMQLHYQPQVSAVSREVEGYEALLRWNHPLRGQVSPALFIPVAEQAGMIHELGDWALRTACHEATTWERPLRIAVNLSPVQFHSKALLANILEALRQSGLDPERLELEITESVLLDASERTLTTLNSLKEIGVNIAMDDFGTGYSSLGKLRSFPFDKLKIDRSFIRDIARQADALSIVTLVIGMAKGLGMTTTAEGVETEEQYQCLRQLGCDQIQGYLFGAAQPSDDLGISRRRPIGQSAAGGALPAAAATPRVA